MTALNARRVPSVLAGVLAMVGSLTALATVVWSDFAEAAESDLVQLADELAAPQPVKLAKIEHKQLPEYGDLLLANGLDESRKPQPSKKSGKRKSRLDFGSFEGY